MNERTFTHIKKKRLQTYILILMAFVLSACTAVMPKAQQTNQAELIPNIDNTINAIPQQLRVVNSGREDIYNLQILFPRNTADSEATRIGFGDIPAREITDYQLVPDGVYRYAAYEYMFDGRLVNQPVIDWLGESPLKGEQFTYRIELDSYIEIGNQIQLIEVVVDKP